MSISLTAMSANAVIDVEIKEYQPIYQPLFEQLNRAWIERFFWMEPVDEEVLQRPEIHIINKGGKILMAVHNNQIVGTVALKFASTGVYEFTKMAVAEEFRGKRVGRALAKAAIEKAQSLGASRIILYSNTILEPAIELYKKLGFREVDLDGPYKRSNIKMELTLNHNVYSEYMIRSATLDDALLISGLGAQTFREAFESQNSESDIQLYLEKNFSISQIQDELSESGNVFFLVFKGSEAIAYAKVRNTNSKDAPPHCKPIEIERLYLLQQYVGKGIGKLLMEKCLDFAKEKNYDTVWLGVWEHNEKALAFYKKFGFCKYGAHNFLLGEDLQTDLLYKKDLH